MSIKSVFTFLFTLIFYKAYCFLDLIMFGVFSCLVLLSDNIKFSSTSSFIGDHIVLYVKDNDRR